MYAKNTIAIPHPFRVLSLVSMMLTGFFTVKGALLSVFPNENKKEELS